MTRPIAGLAFALLAIAPLSAQAPQPDAGRLAEALARLQPQRPGVTDAYLVVAALDSDPVFGREARETRRVLASRFGADGRSIVLAEDEGADRADAAGTPANLELALAKAAALMDREEDVLVVYITTHGTQRAGLNFKHALHGEGIVSPRQFADSLARHGARNRLIILQACYSGQFVPALAAPRTVVVTAASSMKPSFGCSPGNDWTFFGHALINQAMRSKDTLVRQIRRAVVTIIGWEQKLKIDPSNPQVSVGSETGFWLAALDAPASAVPAAPVGRPPSELGD